MMTAMLERDLTVTETFTATDDGWKLHLRRTLSPSRFEPGSRPLLIVPGYGMNSFIFSYHPRGTSMERTLAEAGFEVWSMNLRGQGPSRCQHRSPAGPTLYHYATVDVPCAIEHVLQTTRTRARDLVLIGCSLGGSIAYSYLALRGDHRVARLITMGAPLRWDQIHPLVRVMFASPTVVGALRLSRTRELIRGAMPLLLRAPSLLSLYMNAATIDTRRMSEMTRTVEDPHPAVNRDIARWLKRRDLELDGVNITRAMRSIRLPLLVVLANRDGIVPERTALTAVDAWGSPDVDVLRVGDAHNWYAHANLFVADDAPDLVFQPMIRWLQR
jgi:pimeloyl-ACP methyl ester carboxylesterase